MSRRIALAILFVIALSLTAAVAWSDGGPPLLRLRLGTFDIAQIDSAGIPQELMLESYPPGEKGLYVVQFSGPLVTEQREALNDAGAELIGYLPDYAYLVVMGDDAFSRVSSWSMDGSLDAISVGIYQPAFKIDPAVLQACSGDDEWPIIIIQQYGEAEEALARISAAVLEGGAKAEILGSSIWGAKQRLRVKVHREDLRQFATQMARRPNVVWIEKYYAPELYMVGASYVTQCYRYKVWPIWDHGIRGEGQIIAVADTGLDADMCFFYDETQGLPNSSINHNQRKTIVYYDRAGDGRWDTCAGIITHGTHVTGILAAYAPDDYTYRIFRGMAYQAKLVVQDVGRNCVLEGIPDDLNELFQQAMDAGARLHNNSWGNPGSNSYDSNSQDADEFMWNNPTFLIAFAAGNFGPALHTVTPPATAKNVVSVGATEAIDLFHHNPEDLASYSSHGPAEDGRICPTLVAPGVEVASALGDGTITSFQCETIYYDGTSMACPVIVGSAALVRQYYTDGYYPTGQAKPSDGFEPSAALLKATLINSGMDLTGRYLDGALPGTAQGWGRIVLEDALYFAGDEGGLTVYDVSPGLSTGETDSYQVQCDGALKLEITLVWTDYPSSLSAEVNLVNDLDLSVLSPDSVAYLGNNYSEGQSEPGGAPYRLNPVECVQLDKPTSGTYQISVSAHNVPIGPQPYALVITLDRPTGPKGCSDGSVSPQSGGESTTFTFSVHYYDIYDTMSPPVTGMCIDDQPHEMTLSSGDDNDGIYTFETTLPAGVHTHYFSFRDWWGNVSRLPKTGSYEGPIVDEVPPQSSCRCAECSSYPITVDFSASDAESSVKKTDLYYKFESGDWAFSGESEGGTAGYFAFKPSDGEGTYYFYTIATDVAGNVENAPDAYDAETIYDAVAPSSSCSGPESGWGTFELSFVASDNSGGCGVGQTYLWYKYEDESWSRASGPQSGESGTFTFTSEHEGGTYYFYTIAADLAGNEEEAPSAPDCEVLIKRVKPKSNCTAPEFSNRSDVSIEFIVTFSQAAVKSVRLWYRSEDKSWSDTGQDETGDAGCFAFHIPKGEGRYYFYTIATDSAGMVEDAPDSPDTSVILDLTKPVSSCASPTCTPSGQIPVGFSAADGGSNVAQTELWVKFEGGDWLDTGLSTQGTAGKFDFAGTEGVDRYYFYTTSKDNAGNVEDPPTDYDSDTLVDIKPPSSVSQSPRAASTSFAVTFEAQDEGCGVNLTSLFWRVQGGEWVLFGEPLSGETGAFYFEPSQGERPYEFYTISLDLAGNEEAPPAAPDSVTVFDTTCPRSSCTCPQYSRLASIAVSFSASNDASGISSTSLWYRTGKSEFVDSGLSMAGHRGDFEFVATDDEGTYDFYTIAIDGAANREGPPAAPDASCVFDQTAPRSSCTSPDLANVSPFAVEFVAEEVLSGVSHAMLFFKFEDGEWENSGLLQHSPSGHFSFSVPYGAGSYQFASLCCDMAGNMEDLPDAPDCATFFDEDIPVSSCSSPAITSDPAILVHYAANGGRSGLVRVELWFIFGDGEPQDSGLSAVEPEGAIEFTADRGDGLYGFFTIATNADGMRETQPAGPDSFTLLDCEKPSSFCVSPPYSSSATVTVQYEVIDNISDSTEVDLYYRFEEGDWHYFGTKPSGGAGTFDFSLADQEGVWGFATVAHDQAGNVEELPDEADAMTLVDWTPPQVTVSTLLWASRSTLSINYAASDAVSGVAEVSLWHRFNQGAWEKSDVSSEQPIGSLEFEFGDSQGQYHFWVEASDFALNSTGEPQTAQASTVYDAGPPSSACYAPEYATHSPIKISFEAQDALCDQLVTRLFYRLNDGQWRSLAQVTEGLFGEFVLETATDGRYEFYSVSTDLAGNSNANADEAAADCATILDTVPPSSSCAAPNVWADPFAAITFYASDETSGVSRTVLWVSFEDGDWEDTRLSAEGENGLFSFALDRGEGTYSFYTICKDLASNVEAKDEADTTMIFDATAPDSSCVSPQYATGEFDVTFTTNEIGSGTDTVSILYKFGESDWQDTGLLSSKPSGKFTFVPKDGDGTYSFAALALDLAGNQQSLPTQADCATVVDTEPPTSTASCRQLTNQRHVKITFDASDTTSGIARVALCYSFEDGPFTYTSDSSTSVSGSFEFDLRRANGTYSFYTIATDNAGLSQEAPAEAHCAVLLDTVPPVSSCECPGSTQSPSVEISFTASDEGSGVAKTSILYRLSGAKTWVDAGLSSPGGEGTFDFRFPDGGGMYEFRTVALDLAGNTESPGADPWCATLYTAGNPDLVVSVDSHDFGPMTVGDVCTWEITLSNAGNTDLVVESIETTGQPYYVGGPGSFTLGSNKQIGLNLFYFPTSDLTTVDGELIIRSNDTDTPTKRVLLTGQVSHSDRPFFTMTTDRPEYHEADTFCALYTLGNPGQDVFVDAYAAVKFPDDPDFYFLMALTTTPTPVSLFMPQGAYITPTVLLSFEITSPLPEGDYLIYAALCRPGTEFEFVSELSVARLRYK